jgi:FtsZ-binding cell division protein ZapB
METNPDVVKFRASVGGFNRMDVIHYIEQTTLEHQKACKALEDEAAKLRQEADAQRTEAEQLRAEVERLQAENDALQEALDSATDPNAPVAEPVAEPAEDIPAEPEAPVEDALPTPEKELAAYRRAEAVERIARRRASTLYTKVTAIQQASLQKLEALNSETGTLYNQITGDLEQLQTALTELHIVFDETEQDLRKLDLPVRDDGEGSEN